LATLEVWPIETYSPNFVNFGPGIPCPCYHPDASFLYKCPSLRGGVPCDSMPFLFCLELLAVFINRFFFLIAHASVVCARNTFAKL